MMKIVTYNGELLKFPKDILPNIDWKFMNDQIIKAVNDLKIANPNYTCKCYIKTYSSETDIIVLSIYYDKQAHIEIKFVNASLLTFCQLMNDITFKLKSMPKFENMEKNNMNLTSKNYTMSPEEVDFNRYADQMRAETETQIEKARAEMVENQKKTKAENIAKEYRYFYNGLILAGFTEDQAMTILLNKYTINEGS